MNRYPVGAWPLSSTWLVMTMQTITIRLMCSFEVYIEFIFFFFMFSIDVGTYDDSVNVWLYEWQVHGIYYGLSARLLSKSL